MQRFALLDMRNMAIAVMVGIVKIGEGIIMRRAFDSHVVNPDFFKRHKIIEHDHFAGAHESHLSDFSWLQPTVLHRRESIAGKFKRNIRHILDIGIDMRVPLAVDRHRIVSKDMKNDGKVMGSKIPGNIEIFLEEAEIQTLAVDVADLAYIAAFDNLKNFPDRFRLSIGVAYQKDQALMFGDIQKLLTLRGRSCHGLFDQYMFSGEQCRLCHREMKLKRSSDGDGINSRVTQHLFKISIPMSA